jgi:ATP-binding cassette subfamily C protein
MQDFLMKFFYLLDRQDRRDFIGFLILLFISGMLSVLGIGAIIPFITLLVKPEYVQQSFLHAFGYKQAVAVCVFLLIFSFWAKNIFAFIIIKWQSRFLGRLVAKIQEKLFDYYIHAPYAYHLKRSSPKLINNVNVEIPNFYINVVGQVGVFLNESITTILVTLVLLIINPIFSISVIGFIFIAAYLFMRSLQYKMKNLGISRSQSDVGLMQCVIQGLGGIKETKIYKKEFFFIERAHVFIKNVARVSAFNNMFQQSPRLFIEVISVTVVLLMMLVFIMRGYSGSEMLVLVSVFGIASAQLLPSVTRLINAFTYIRYGSVSLDKIYQEFLIYDQLEKDFSEQLLPPLNFKEAISLKDIYFNYDHKTVLNKVNLSIYKGQKVAFVGCSGAGKTTLVDIILGLLIPSRGQILVDGTLVDAKNLAQWQQHFGYIPQMIYLYDCSLRENIAFGVALEEIDDAQVWRCLEVAALDDFVRSECSAGLDTLVGENGIRLSGGQRQRVGIARALYRNPDILVMDEATAAMDNQTEHIISRALDRASQGRTIITIAHRLTTIKHYDLICMMEKGRIIDAGNYEHLLLHCEPFRKMVTVNEYAQQSF